MPRATTRETYPFSETIGPAVKEARKALNLSDIKFARKAGISRRHLVEFQKGANATLLIAFKAMRALGLTTLSHDFQGETLTLSITDTPASIHPATLIETSQQLEHVATLLLKTSHTLREAVAKAGPPESPLRTSTSKSSLSHRAATVVDEFGSHFRTLDAGAKLDLLERLEAAYGSAPPVQATAKQTPNKRRKRAL
ncbi:MAG: helix-turn-helix transcriptional regulator [Acidobacteriota bacterium]